MSLLSKVSANGPGSTFVRTASFKRQCAREERLVDSGNLLKSAARELPIEAEVRRNRRPMCMEDLRLALQLGDGFLGQSPFVAGAIANARFLDTHGIDDVTPQKKTLAGVVGVNGVGPGADSHNHRYLSDGLTVTLPDPSHNPPNPPTGGDTNMSDAPLGDEQGWLGAGVESRVLDDALDEVLGLADL